MLTTIFHMIATTSGLEVIRLRIQISGLQSLTPPQPALSYQDRSQLGNGPPECMQITWPEVKIWGPCMYGSSQIADRSHVTGLHGLPDSALVYHAEALDQKLRLGPEINIKQVLLTRLSVCIC